MEEEWRKWVRENAPASMVDEMENSVRWAAKWRDDLIAKAETALGLAVEFAAAHEAWEASVIMSDEAWDGGASPFPKFTEAIYDGFMDVQGKRNAFISAIEGSDNG